MEILLAVGAGANEPGCPTVSQIELTPPGGRRAPNGMAGFFGELPMRAGRPVTGSVAWPSPGDEAASRGRTGPYRGRALSSRPPGPSCEAPHLEQHRCDADRRPSRPATPPSTARSKARPLRLKYQALAGTELIAQPVATEPDCPSATVGFRDRHRAVSVASDGRDRNKVDPTEAQRVAQAMAKEVTIRHVRGAGLLIPVADRYTSSRSIRPQRPQPNDLLTLKP